MRRVITGLGVAGMLSGCWLMRTSEPAAVPAASGQPQIKEARAVDVRPLPGGLDEEAYFDSNSPEIVQQPGILLSSLAGNPGVHQNHPIKGAFTVFSHHIAKDEAPDANRLYVGLLAVNQGDRTVTVSFGPGASYLSQPDALFVPLPMLTDDPNGTVYAGPGDRVATDLLHGKSNMPAAEAVLPPHGSYLAYALPIPTGVAIPPPINGRTTILRGRADGPVGLAEVAVFAARDAAGNFIPPGAAAFQAELAKGRLAGPRDVPPTSPFDRNAPPPKGGFKYGRVAGVARGAKWTARVEAPTAHGTVGYPIASLYLNRLGTTQDQSAPLETRYADTAYEAHGNYGVTYELTASLPPGRYAFGLGHPVGVANGQAQYLQPPNKPVMFRGPIKLSWGNQVRYVHVVLHHGEEAPAFAKVEVPAGKPLDVTLTLSYPADATPPQLLTITRD